MISKELLSEALGYEVTSFSHNGYTNGKIGKNFMLHINPSQSRDKPSVCVIPKESINIYELAHLNLKQWANFKNVFNIIDWSGEPEEIIAKAEEIMNEIN